MTQTDMTSYMQVKRLYTKVTQLKSHVHKAQNTDQIVADIFKKTFFPAKDDTVETPTGKEEDLAATRPYPYKPKKKSLFTNTKTRRSVPSAAKVKVLETKIALLSDDVNERREENVNLTKRKEKCEEENISLQSENASLKTGLEMLNELKANEKYTYIKLRN